MWDKDPGCTELVGQITEDLRNVYSNNSHSSSKGRTEPPLRWYNMYGAPEFKLDDSISATQVGSFDDFYVFE